MVSDADACEAEDEIALSALSASVTVIVLHISTRNTSGKNLLEKKRIVMVDDVMMRWLNFMTLSLSSLSSIHRLICTNIRRNT